MDQDADRAAAELVALVRAEEFLAFMPLDDAAVWLSDVSRSADYLPVVGPTGTRVR